MIWASMSQDMDLASGVEIRLAATWDVDQIVDLYRAAGWWKETYDAAGLGPLMRGSFAFAVAVDRMTGRPVGMGRVISDGVSDGYIQDLMVLPGYRRHGIGGRIVRALLNKCKDAGIQWIGLVAEPGSEEFHRGNGFAAMPGHVPMIYKGEP
jgi:GNAT superfamily N-acetyltransferase